MTINLRFRPTILIPILFLILALLIPIIILEDPNPPYPPIPDYFTTFEYYLFRFGGLSGVHSLPNSLPFLAITGIFLMLMFVEPRLRWEYDLVVNLLVGIAQIFLWSFLVILIFVIPSSWIPSWFPYTPIIGLELVIAYRIIAHYWVSDRHGSRNIRT